MFRHAGSTRRPPESLGLPTAFIIIEFSHHHRKEPPLYGSHLRRGLQQKAGAALHSSHSFVVSVRTELADLTQMEAESTRLYTLLQQSVDRKILQVGYLPEGDGYGTHSADDGSSRPHGDGNHLLEPATQPVPVHHEPGDTWVCSDKQSS